MSSSATTPDTRPTDDPPATDGSMTASDRLWAALHARSGGATEQLAADAGIGRSTAAKILARWVTDGTVKREAGEGKKSASRFAIATAADDTAPAAVTPPGSGTSDPQGTPDGVAHDEPDTDTGVGNTRTATADGATTALTAARPDVVGRDAEARQRATGGDIAPDPVTGADDQDGATGEAAEAVTSPSEAAPDTPDENAAGEVAEAPSAVAPGATVPAVAPKASRLAPGALHGMVEDYLRDHPGEEFGPTKIGHDLGRSSGAVSNALDRLVVTGYAVRTKDRPKRYAHAPAIVDPAEPADHAEPADIEPTRTEEPTAQEG